MDTTQHNHRHRDVIDPFHPAVQEAASAIVAAWIRGDPTELAWVTRQLAAATAIRWVDFAGPPHADKDSAPLF
jgi:hypothetical protein